MIKRNITSQLLAALSDTPVVFVAGARQTGKSTIVNHLADEGYKAQYISFDDYNILTAAKADPQGFIAGLSSNVIIDEVQRVPEIFLAIKAIVDKNRKPGQFLLTGSANIFLIPKIADSLAGRVEIQILRPFSQSELRNTKGSLIDTLFNKKEIVTGPLVTEMELWDMVISGGYPDVINRSENSRKSAWFRNYLTTLLQRDVRDITHIDSLTIIPDLLQLIAARSANLLNFADFSRSVQIPQTSLKRYFTLLESLFLVHRVAPWSSNFNSRLTKAHKIHLGDTGLVAYLLGVNAKRLIDDRTLAGQLLETFVVNEILKLSSWSKTQPRVYYFRTTSGREVDIILEDARGKCIAIEIKSSSSLTSKCIDGIKFFRDAIGDRFVKGIVIYTGNEIIPFQSNIHAVPVSVLWGN